MIKDVKIKKLARYEDERGWLTEIYRADELDLQPAMSYVSLTRPGVSRGPHEHEKQADIFVFIGPGEFDLHLWDRRTDSETNGQHEVLRVGENAPTLVTVPPGVVHGYKCVSDVAGWCINLPDKLYKGPEKREEIDEIRWEKDINSPYKIE
jgi:dTDP-4-dehydrorhamnose 3,5-epimerase